MIRKIAPHNPDSFQEAQTNLVEGDIILVEPGYYVLNEPFNPPNGVTIQAANPDLPPIISGLNVQVSGWETLGSDGIYKKEWNPEWSVPVDLSDKVRLQKKDWGAYREILVADRDPIPYQQIQTVDLEPGQFFIEADPLHENPTAIYVRPRGQLSSFRMSTLTGLLNSKPNGQAPSWNLTIKDLIFEYAACHYRHGMVQTAPRRGSSTTIQNCEIRFSGSEGLYIGGSKNVIKDNVVHHSGKGDITGWGPVECLIEGNTTFGGNWKDCNHGHSCGNKFGGASHNVIRFNRFLGSDHIVDGLWLDVDADNNLVLGNRIDGVSRAGILAEISRGNTISSNIISDVRPLPNGNFRGGINLAESSDSLVTHNTIFNCPRGVYLKAGSGRHLMLNNQVLDNFIYNCREGFLVEDQKGLYTPEELATNRILSYEVDPTLPTVLENGYDLPDDSQLIGKAAGPTLLKDFYGRPHDKKVIGAVTLSPEQNYRIAFSNLREILKDV